MTDNIEFVVNEFITLRLEGEETVIYVAGERFRQCKFLLLELPIKNISSFDEIESIDEAADKLDRSQETRIRDEIPRDVEFWGHCSNLQVWCEYNYDTRLLHSNLAFPLLKRLTEVGDTKAKKVLKDEIGKRLASGYRSTVLFLYNEGYLDYLTKEELFSAIKEMNYEKFEGLWYNGDLIFLNHEIRVYSLLENEEAEAILNIEAEISKEFKIALSDHDEFESPSIKIKNRKVIELNLMFYLKRLKDPNENLKKLIFLKELEISSNELTELPNFISELKYLEGLFLVDNKISILPYWIGKLKSLKWLDLTGNDILELPWSLLKLDKLKEIGFNEEDGRISEDTKKILSKLKEKGIIIR